MSIYRSYGEVGLYALGYRLIELLGLLPAVVMSSVFPLLSRHLAEGGLILAATHGPIGLERAQELRLGDRP